MKKAAVILVVALFVVSCASVFAGSTSSSSKSSSKSHSSHVTGEVVSVDAANNSFVIRETLKDKTNKEITVSCEAGTKVMVAGKTATMNELAAGDHVTVQYSPSADGKIMAKSVSISKPHPQPAPSKS
jgi:hypothetical protein